MALGRGVVAVVDGLESREGAAFVAEIGSGHDPGGGRVIRRRGRLDPPIGGTIGGGRKGEAEPGSSGVGEVVGGQSRGHGLEKDGVVRTDESEDLRGAAEAIEMGPGKKGPATVGGDRFKGPAAEGNAAVAATTGSPADRRTPLWTRRGGDDGGMRRGRKAGFTKLDGCRCLGNLRIGP